MGKYDSLFDAPAGAPARGRYAALFDDAPAAAPPSVAAAGATAEGPAYQPPVPPEQAALAAPGHGTQPQDMPRPSAPPPPADIPWYQQIAMGVGGGPLPAAAPAPTLTGLITGQRPAPQMTPQMAALTALRHGLPGGSWADEFGGLADWGISKIPGVRDLAAQVSGNPSLADPSVPLDARAQVYRNQLAQAHAQHPIIADLGEGTGMALPMLIPGGAAAEEIGQGASALAAGARAGVKVMPLGFSQGAGDSEKLFTDPAGALKAGATGAAIAGTAGAVLEPAIGVITRKVGERMSRQIQRELGEGETGTATATLRRKAARDAEDVATVVMEDPQVAAAIRRPAKKGLPVIQRKIEEVGAKLPPLYDAVDQAVGGVRVGDYVDHLDKAAARLAATGKGQDEQIASVLQAAAKRARGAADIGGTAAGYDPNKVIPTRNVRALITDLQTTAADTMGAFNATTAHKKAVQVAAVGEDFLRQHLNKAADTGGAAANAVRMIRDEINPRFAALKNIEAVKRDLLAREEGAVTSLKSLMKGSPVVGGLLEAGRAMAHGDIKGAAMGFGIAAAPTVAKKAGAAANRAVAALMVAARRGSVPAGLIQHAIEAGVPRATALKLAGAGTIGLQGKPSNAP